MNGLSGSRASAAAPPDCLHLLHSSPQEYLLLICIPCQESCSWDCPALEPAAAASSDTGHRRRSTLALAVEHVLSGGVAAGRGLLAASEELDAYSCAQAAETCGPGSEPFWSQLAIIQVGARGEGRPGDPAQPAVQRSVQPAMPSVAPWRSACAFSTLPHTPHALSLPLPSRHTYSFS